MSQKDKEQRQADRAARAGEAATKPRPDAPVHNHVNPVFDTKPLPPMDGVLLLKLAELGNRVRMLIGGRMMTVELTDYEIDSDTYDGEAHSNRKLDQESLPIVRDVHGIVFYPHPTRPDYAFQAVRPGQDESVLINIANASIATRQAAREPVNEVSE